MSHNVAWARLFNVYRISGDNSLFEFCYRSFVSSLLFSQSARLGNVSASSNQTSFPRGVRHLQPYPIFLCLFPGEGWAQEKWTSGLESRRESVTSLGVRRGHCRSCLLLCLCGGSGQACRSSSSCRSSSFSLSESWSKCRCSSTPSAPARNLRH